MRIVAGAARGRPLAAPPGQTTRPTSDKVRGALFNVLGQHFEGGRVLDLYAGTGALALEALSRGCERAVCVEADRRAAGCIRKNAIACGVADRVEIRCEPVERALPRLAAASFDLVFLDPPYRAGPAAALATLARLLAERATVVAEHDAGDPPPDDPPGLVLEARRNWGDTGISIYRRR